MRYLIVNSFKLLIVKELIGSFRQGWYLEHGRSPDLQALNLSFFIIIEHAKRYKNLMLKDIRTKVGLAFIVAVTAVVIVVAFVL